MRFREIKHLIIQEARLDELKMSPSALEQFAKSEAAQGIQAGFEAELIFRGAAKEGTGTGGPDMDLDTTIDSIDEMRDFFSENNSYRQIDELVKNIENDGWLDYFFEKQAEWIQENLEKRLDYEFEIWFGDEGEDLIRTALEEANEYNDREIDDIIRAGLRHYDEKDWDSRETYNQMDAIYQDYKVDVAEKAREDFNADNEDRVREELEEEFNQGEDVDFGDYLDYTFGNRYASTIWDEYQGTVDWPYYSEDYEEGGFNEFAANNIASDLEDLLGMKVISSSGYHSAKRSANLWIIEPDSSLEPDDSSDMGAEIVSPPMPLSQCLEKMESLFTWAQGDGNAYANSSTGFHMGVSLPITGGKVDFVKLALFLGDEYVLEAFDRSGNTYAEAAMKKIRNRIKGGNAKIDEAMKLMHDGLIELAERAIMGSTGDGFGKYTSINPKGAYIEFRSAGGEDYIKDIKKAKNTLLRYAQAMSVAANPAAERQEYYKKLYKLISPAGGSSTLDLFARYASGNISKEDLMTQWAKTALEKDAPETQRRSTWKVYDAERGKYLPNYQYSGYTESEALALFKQAHAPGSSMEDFKKYMQHMKYELRNVSASTGKWAIIDRGTGETLEVIDSEHRGDAADLAMEKYAGKGIDYYIEPVPSDTPKSKLSRRVELAKRIVQQKNQANKETDVTGRQDRVRQDYNRITQPQRQWQAYRISTNSPIGDPFPAASEQAAMVNFRSRVLSRTSQDPADFTVVEIHAQQSPATTPVVRRPEQVVTDAGIPMWEIYVRETGQAVSRFPDHNQTAAWSTAQQWLRDAHAPESTWNAYSVRPLTQAQGNT